MSEAIAISVENVSKAYRIWATPASRLISPLQAALARLFPSRSGVAQYLHVQAAKHYRDFYALHDVSFTVKKGESVGIIGRNGSGKSTLLQIIAGTLQPTGGNAKINGRVAALLELGSGFNPEFTGRENIYLNGAILGLSRAEVDAKYESIVAFADIGDFIDQPVKTYSSGMIMRLAFSVQTSVDPDILIIDEALAVGDAQFIAKCINRISDFIRSGRTLLFVSHEVGIVKQLTSHALFLERGRQKAFGITTETVLAYMSTLSMPTAAVSVDPDRYARDDAPYRFERLQLSRIGEQSPLESFPTGTPVRLTVSLTAGPPGNSRLVFSIYNYMGIIVCSSETELPVSAQGRKLLVVEFELPGVRLAPGNYRVNFAVRNGIEIAAWAKNALHFSVTGDTTETFIYREDIIPSFSLSD